MVTLKLIDCESLKLNAALSSLTKEIDLLRTILRARKAVGLLQKRDLIRFMEVDAEIERTSAALLARNEPSADIASWALPRHLHPWPPRSSLDNEGTATIVMGFER